MPFFSRRAVAEINGRLDYLCQHIYALERRSITIEQKENLIMATQQELQQAIADLQVKVQAETAVEQSAIVLMGGLSQQLKDALANAADPAAAIQSVRDVIGQMDANDQALAAAVATNTPAGVGGAQPATSAP